jgi:nitrogen fixation/metabolism regulation signal transduction histidine kinase
MGGAYLLDEPYTAEKLYDQLKKQAAKMLTDERGVKIDKDNKIVYLTVVFNKYKAQFIKKYGHIKRFRNRDEHIRSYLNCILDYVPADTAKYLINGDYAVEFQNYNWQLNEQTGK